MMPLCLGSFEDGTLLVLI